MDLHKELMKALHSVSLGFQHDEVNEGFRSSLQEHSHTLTITTAAQLSSMGEIPHLVEVWGIDPLMKKFFDSIYPSGTSHSSHQ